MVAHHHRKARSFRTAGAEGGQVIVLTVLVLIVLLGMAALVVDVGYAYYTQRSLQSSTDAAALAGAQELPNAAVATTVAQRYSGVPGAKNEQANVPSVTASVETLCRPEAPCKPVNAIEVEQTAVVSTLFARVLGIDTYTVSTRAVAWQRSGGTPWAIFAYDSECGSLVLKVNGGDATVRGAMHTNGKLEIDGEGFTADYTSAPDKCEHDVEEGSDLGGGSDQPEVENTLQPWPRYYDEDEFLCTVSRPKIKLEAGDEINGTYCASESFEANGDDLKGTITVLAPKITLNGNNHVFRPHQHDMLFFSTGTKDDELIVNGNGNDLEGVFFSPRGRIKLNGDSSSIKGLIEGFKVEVNGNGFEMIGDGPDTGDRGIALIE